MTRLLPVPALAVAALVLTACGGDGDQSGSATASTSAGGASTGTELPPVSESVDLVDPGGSIIGNVTFTDADNGTQVEIDASGLPEGSHPVQLRQVGACDPAGGGQPDFASAGAPLDLPAGGQAAPVVVGPDGLARASSLVEEVRLLDLMDADGTAVVIEAADDGAPPVACGALAGGQ